MDGRDFLTRMLIYMRSIKERQKNMATKEDLANAVTKLLAADTANKAATAALTAERDQLKAANVDLQAQLATAQADVAAAKAAADTVDDATVNAINQVAADITPAPAAQ